jgi:hypothetical protein
MRYQKRQPEKPRLCGRVVGVTGHRDLIAQDIARLEQEVLAILEMERRRSPDGALTVVSALAEGADRLVARVALNHLGARLFVPLPLPMEEYLQDFPEASSKAEFTALLERSTQWYALPRLSELVPSAMIPPDQASRDLQYALVGAYIAAHCHLLLALWDGKALERLGGTSHVVRLRQEGIVEPYRTAITALCRRVHCPLDEREADNARDAEDSLRAEGALYHIQTPRASHHSDLPPIA